MGRQCDCGYAWPPLEPGPDAPRVCVLTGEDLRRDEAGDEIQVCGGKTAWKLLIALE